MEVVSEKSGFQQLDVQRRMHSSIATFPGLHFYDGRLENGCNDEDRPPIAGFEWPPGVRVCFVNCDGGCEEDAGGKSTRNLEETKLLRSVLGEIVASGEVESSKIAVITGYSAQRQLL